MYQTLNKFLSKRKESFPKLFQTLIEKLEKKAEYEKTLNWVVDQLLANPPGFRVQFWVNGVLAYAQRDKKNEVIIKEALPIPLEENNEIR
jgi:hypothetical protein